MNPKTTERFKADTYKGNKVGSIVILSRSDEDSYIRNLSKEELTRNVINMNYFEFSWLHDNLIRHMFFTGKASLKSVSEKYNMGQSLICSTVKGLQLGGKTPELWIDLLENHISQKQK